LWPNCKSRGEGYQRAKNGDGRKWKGRYYTFRGGVMVQKCRSGRNDRTV